MHLIEKSHEVFVTDDPIVQVDRAEVEFLKERVKNAPRGRVRLCAHARGDDLLHEMLIVLARRTYIRPHKHLVKSESFHIIEGAVDVVVFDDAGAVCDVVQLGELPSGRKFFYRLSGPRFHTLMIHTDPVVFHETTNGPFRQGDAILAPWAPDEADEEACHSYLATLSGQVSRFLAAREKVA